MTPRRRGAPRAGATAGAADGSGAPGLYLHLPFCAAVCPYCDFAVRVGDEEARGRFAAALAGEIEGLAGGRLAPSEEPVRSVLGRLVRGELGAFDTVYLGGGTPSLLAPGRLAEILATVRRHLPVAPDARLLLEANPEDVDARRLAAWRELGVSFLSHGVQSLDDAELAFLGRHHDAATARRAVAAALAAGFDTVSLDLIYALPDQTAGAWRRNLEAAAALGPHHLSCYELEIHRRTAFGRRLERGELEVPPEERRADLFRLTHRRLAELGYRAYEVSSFARAPRHRSPHNVKYWRHVPYLGLGPSAHSYAEGVRWWTVRSAALWQRRTLAGEWAVEGWEALSPAEQVLEAAMMGLRTPGGIDLAAVRRRWGIDLEALNRRRLAGWEGRGLVRAEGGWVRPTLPGMALADRLAAELELRAAGDPRAVRTG